MSIKTILPLILLFSGACFFSSGSTETVVRVSNKPITDTLKVEIDNANIYKLHLVLEGHIDDTIQINNRKFSPADLNKNLHYGDQYGPDFFFQYDPYKSDSVDLKITFIFHYSR